MRSQINLSNISSTIIRYYYWMMIIGYLFVLISGMGSVVYLSSILLLLGFVFKKKERIRASYILYFCYCIFSCVLCIVHTNNSNLALQASAYCLIPMIMLFIPKEDSRKFFQKSMNAILCSLVLAVILFLFPTQRYAEYLFNRSLIGNNSIHSVKASSFQGLYGITTLSNLATCSAIYYYLKILMKQNKTKNILKFAFCSILTILAGRRSAIAALLVGILLVDLWLWLNSKVDSRFLLIHIIICVAIGFALLYFYDYIFGVINRVLDIQAALDERDSGWGSLLSSLGYQSIFGKGIGTSGHLATAAGGTGNVHDGQYVLLLVETGIFGLLIFGFIIFSSIRVYLSSNPEKIFPVIVVIIFLIQCIGSNVLEMPLLASLFWYCISACTTKKDDRKEFYRYINSLSEARNETFE